jgi:galactokinase
MSEKDEEFEEFNERFETIEQALKYIADSQAKSEFINKKAQVEWRKKQVESEKRMERIEKLQESTQKHLDHITKIVRFLVDENEDKNRKIEEVGTILTRK